MVIPPYDKRVGVFCQVRVWQADVAGLRFTSREHHSTERLTVSRSSQPERHDAGGVIVERASRPFK